MHFRTGAWAEIRKCPGASRSVHELGKNLPGVLHSLERPEGTVTTAGKLHGVSWEPALFGKSARGVAHHVHELFEIDDAVAVLVYLLQHLAQGLRSNLSSKTV